jgi:hypothetical protein
VRIRFEEDVLDWDGSAARWPRSLADSRGSERRQRECSLRKANRSPSVTSTLNEAGASPSRSWPTGPLPPRPRQTLPPHGQARAGPGASRHSDDDVPRDGMTYLEKAEAELPNPAGSMGHKPGPSYLTRPRPRAIVGGPEPRPARGECAWNAPDVSTRIHERPQRHTRPVCGPADRPKGDSPDGG